jgi:tryptophanyl-tRNA synthetase
VGVDQDPHIRFTRDIAQSHRLYNVTVTKDGKPGIFVKGNTDSIKLLDKAQQAVQKKGYSIKRITRYNALYILDKNIDMDGIDRELAKIELDYGGYGFMLPSSTYHRFMTGLTGEKMSSSKPQTAIFLTDTPHEAQKKIQSAKTGGAISLAEQKKYGGNPDKCVVYELFLYHLLSDDKKLAEIYGKCRNGKQRCGDCKTLAIELVTTFLEELEGKRKEAKDKLSEYIK